ncbi:hypothetical protein N665_0121s0002 [Sinapis alba]|nr:hypothetical protein N665_0121s0002 [Sinapis alba]
MSSPLLRCSSKGKAVATGSDSESSGSPLIRRPRTITLGGMDDPRPTTADLALLDDNERDVVRYSLELLIIFRLSLPSKAFEDLSFKRTCLLGSRSSSRQSTKGLGLLQQGTLYESWFTNCSLWWPLPEFLTMYCNRRKIALGQYTTNGIRIMVTLTVLAAELGITMSVRLFEELTMPSITGKTGFFYGKMVPKYNVITGKPSKVNFWHHRYFYDKINEASFEDPSVVLNGYFNANIDRLSKWSQGGSGSFLEEVEAIRTLSHQHWPDTSEARIQAALKRISRAEEQTDIPSQQRGRRMGKLDLSSLPSYADTIGTLEHGRGSSDASRPAKRKRDSNVRYVPSRVSRSRSPPPERSEEHLGGDQRDQDPFVEENPPTDPADEARMMALTEMLMEEHPVDPSVEEGLQRDQPQEPVLASHGGEVVEYPHVIDFKYRSVDVPFIEDHEAPARLFRQIKKRGMPELDQLHQDSRYREMTQAGAIVSYFFADLLPGCLSVNIIFCRFPLCSFRFFREMKLGAQEASLAAKTRSLKKKRKEIAELAYKCSSYESQVEALVAEKNEAVEKAELERSRSELLSTELEALKAEKELLDSRCLSLEQEKSELSLDFERTTRRLRESREHEVTKERLRVESVLRQKVLPTYEKMGQFIGEQTKIQSKLALYSQAKGTQEGLEKIQTQGLSMDDVLQKARADKAHLLDELQKM